ncbi:hypothetical protein SRHO_G00121160 [Serrasalmus rhombeus]
MYFQVQPQDKIKNTGRSHLTCSVFVPRRFCSASSSQNWVRIKEKDVDLRSGRPQAYSCTLCHLRTVTGCENLSARTPEWWTAGRGLTARQAQHCWRPELAWKCPTMGPARGALKKKNMLA